MISAGQSIGNYRILNKIGTGGMGAVYLAEHPLIGKRVALKVIHRELASNREVVQRFFQEAKAVNKIGSEHIVEIHDFGVTPEGDHFYIMEFLDGKTLASVLHQDRVIDVVRSLHIGAQIANALASAHAAGIIHRDLKPDNVMLTTRLGDPDFVKLLDFGLAKMFAAGNASAVKTAAGVLLGTPQYMSPEACESRPNTDHRTDIYALGILLFQMMTGVLPFDGQSMGEVLVKQVTQLPPPPRGYNANIPPSVEQILLRCLAKQPDGRFPTMLALREALLEPDRYLTQSPPIAPTRSMAPGEAPVDAKTVMAYAQQQQQAQAATRIGMANELPLAAPRMTMPGNPGVANNKTIVAGGGAAPIAPTPPRKTVALGPDLSVPAQPPTTHTMQIATPLGYSSRPPRKVWPIVLVTALVLGLVGGGLAVARFKHKPEEVATVEPDAAVAPAPATKPLPPPPPPPPAQKTVTPIATTSGSGSAGSASAPVTAQIEIDSTPPGAEVFDPDEHSLGKTPTKLTLPIAATALSYELRLAGYRTTVKQFIVTGNAVLDVPLEKLPVAAVHHAPPPPPPPHHHRAADDLEPP